MVDVLSLSFFWDVVAKIIAHRIELVAFLGFSFQEAPTRGVITGIPMSSQRASSLNKLPAVHMI